MGQKAVKKAGNQRKQPPALDHRAALLRLSLAGSAAVDLTGKKEEEEKRGKQRREGKDKREGERQRKRAAKKREREKEGH